MFPFGIASFENEKEWPSDPALAIAKYFLPKMKIMRSINEKRRKRKIIND